MKVVTADFAGAAFPPGTKVSFLSPTGNTLTGTVHKLLPRRAKVATDQGQLWNVPYGVLTVTAKTPPPAMTLFEIDTLGKHFIREHEAKSGLKPGWRFGFDLAPARGGICRYAAKQITLSVSYCLKASRQEVMDVLLHEIAHAIVGPGHGHDATWKAAARRIGCTAERCHRVEHTAPRWRGRCSCGKEWTRQRLTRRVQEGICRSCGKQIHWKREGMG